MIPVNPQPPPSRYSGPSLPRVHARGCIDRTARQVAEISPSPPLGAERVGVRWGSPAVPSSGATHLTLPSPRIKPAGLRLTPRRVPPSPPASGRRGARRSRKIGASRNVCMPSAKAGAQGLPLARTGGKRLKSVDSRLRGNDGVSCAGFISTIPPQALSCRGDGTRLASFLGCHLVADRTLEPRFELCQNLL